MPIDEKTLQVFQFITNCVVVGFIFGFLLHATITWALKKPNKQVAQKAQAPVQEQIVDEDKEYVDAMEAWNNVKPRSNGHKEKASKAVIAATVTKERQQKSNKKEEF